MSKGCIGICKGYVFEEEVFMIVAREKNGKGV
jgi:hypothetical protein